jgi:hypothetical protein
MQPKQAVKLVEAMPETEPNVLSHVFLIRVLAKSVQQEQAEKLFGARPERRGSHEDHS